MKKVEEYPQHIRQRLIKRGWELSDQLAPHEAFDECCEWEGLSLWGPDLRQWYQDCGVEE